MRFFFLKKDENFINFRSQYNPSFQQRHGKRRSTKKYKAFFAKFQSFQDCDVTPHRCRRSSPTTAPTCCRRRRGPAHVKPQEPRDKKYARPLWRRHVHREEEGEHKSEDRGQLTCRLILPQHLSTKLTAGEYELN